LIWVAKVGALFISAKFFLNYFEDFFSVLTRNYLKNFRFFRADGKDTIPCVCRQVFLNVFYSQLLHSERTDPFFVKRAAKISTNSLPTNLFSNLFVLKAANPTLYWLSDYKKFPGAFCSTLDPPFKLFK